MHYTNMKQINSLISVSLPWIKCIPNLKPAPVLNVFLHSLFLHQLPHSDGAIILWILQQTFNLVIFLIIVSPQYFYIAL